MINATTRLPALPVRLQGRLLRLSRSFFSPRTELLIHFSRNRRRRLYDSVQSRWKYHFGQIFSFLYAQCPCPTARPSLLHHSCDPHLSNLTHRYKECVEGPRLRIGSCGYSVKAERSTSVKLAH